MADITKEQYEDLLLRLEIIEGEIEKINKLANDAMSINPEAKVKKIIAPPVEVKIGNKTYKAKGNIYKVLNKTGGTTTVDLTKMKAAELKEAYEASPTQFVQV